jgi:hypothetical protein
VLPSLVYHMPCPSHPPWLDHSNIIWQGLWVMKLLTVNFSPISYYFIPLMSRYSPQYPFLEYA